MKCSKKGFELLKFSEGLELEAYPDPVSKNDPIKKGAPWTIGWGSTRGVKQGMVITLAQAEQRLLDDVKECEDAINERVAYILEQHQFDALVDFTFNLGTKIFNEKDCTLLRKLNAGDFESAALEFPRWNKSCGKVIKALVTRRASEMKMFLGK